MDRYRVISSVGQRLWWADDEDHAREQHADAFNDEAILSVEVLSMRESNLASEHLRDILKVREDGTVGINYGYNDGGYSNYVYFVTDDGGCLAIDTVIAEIDNVNFAGPDNDGWHIMGYDVNYESVLYDDHTGNLIPSAYDPN